jgi:hypothetical protein
MPTPAAMTPIDGGALGVSGDEPTGVEEVLGGGIFA